jgi:GntR family transcriptional regulator
MRRGEVVERLRGLLDGRLPGDALPSERILSEQLGVSRPTLRAAIEELARDGLVVRRHGVGTFLPARPVVQLMPGDRTPLPPADGDWASEVLRFGVEAAGAQLAQRLRLSPGDDVVRVLRRRIVDGAPMALEDIRLPAALVPRITEEDFAGGSLYRRLRERHGVVAADAVQTTEPTVTDPEESRLLDVPPYSPALQFERVTRETGGRTMELTRSVYRGDRYRITNILTFGPESG